MTTKEQILSSIKVHGQDQKDYYFNIEALFETDQLVYIMDAIDYYITGFSCASSFDNDRDIMDIGQYFLIYNDLKNYINYGLSIMIKSTVLCENILSKIATVVDGALDIYKDTLNDQFPESSVDLANDRLMAIDRINSLGQVLDILKCFLN